MTRHADHVTPWVPVEGGTEGGSDLGEGVELHHQTPPLQQHREPEEGDEGRMRLDVEGEGGACRRDLKEEVLHCPLEGDSSRSLVQREQDQGDQGGREGEANKTRER